MRTRWKHAAAPHIERILRWNVIVALAIGAMLRVSFEFSDTASSRPDGLFVMLFFAAMVMAMVATFRLKGAIAQVHPRRRRIAIAVASFTAQLILLQIVVDRFAP